MAASPPAAAAGAAPEPLCACVWNEQEFAGSRSVWDALLAESPADPLFMSWDWQWCWWRHHAAELGARLRLVAFSNARGRLVGLAPFYAHTVTVRGLLRRCRLELMGIAWRNPRVAYSDYLDVIAAPEYRGSVLAALTEWLGAQQDWQELALCCTPADGLAAQLAREHLGRLAYVREVDPLPAWSIPLPERFEEYLARLSTDVRRKLFRHRDRLTEPRLERITEAQLPDAMISLRQFVSARWSAEAGLASPSPFQLDLARRMAGAGRLRLTRLSTREGTLSIMYNILAGETLYYLQSGFEPSRGGGLSPGYLHFGYAIEEACREGIRRFELLAGTGRHRDYKRDLLAEPVAVLTHHAVRGRWSRWAYGAYERLGAGRW